jgi:hypothetical protein
MAIDPVNEPELAQYPEAFGGAAMVWGISILPAITAATLMNLVVLTWCSVSYFRRRAWPMAWIAWLIVPIWLVTLRFA